jgi:hypothetical protein
MQRCPTRVHASGLNQRSCVYQAFICQCFSRGGGESDRDARGEAGQGHPRVNWATRAPSAQSPPGIRPQAWLTRSLRVYSRFKVSAAREWAESMVMVCFPAHAELTNRRVVQKQTAIIPSTSGYAWTRMPETSARPMCCPPRISVPGGSSRCWWTRGSITIGWRSLKWTSPDPAKPRSPCCAW